MRTAILSAALLAICAPALGGVEQEEILAGKKWLQQGVERGDSKILERALASFQVAAEKDGGTALAHYYMGLSQFRILTVTQAGAWQSDRTRVESGIAHLEKTFCSVLEALSSFLGLASTS